MASDPPLARAPRSDPQLFLVLQGHRLLAGGIRMSLRDASEVAIGRGDANHAELGGGRLIVAVDDPWMSTAHARLAPALNRWSIADAGSKNGTLVNGQLVHEPRVLADGDVIETGHTVFVFRAEVAVDDDDPAIAQVAPEVAGLDTLVPALARSFAAIDRVAMSSVSIAIAGPTGTGKEVVARAIHARSGRPGAFVAVNCGALPETLVATEVFGYRRGAFSGATEDRPGLVRSADRGTLFLDEVAELPKSAQVALLRVLQEREVVPVGSPKPVPVDLRLVAATQRDLASLIAAGTLRDDFGHRMGGFTVQLPALRDRREDLGVLIAPLVRRLAREPAAVTLDPAAARALVRHSWPGNVRELEKCLEAAIALAGDQPIAAHQLLPATEGGAPPPARETGAPDRERLVELLSAHRGNVSAVARELAKAPAQIRRWLKRYALELGQ